MQVGAWAFRTGPGCYGCLYFYEILFFFEGFAW